MSHTPPQLATLADDLAGLAATMAVHRSGAVEFESSNIEGGDPMLHGDPRLLARHLGHYLAAAQVISEHRGSLEPEVVLDVGCGTGLFSGWLHDRVGGELHLADHDPEVLRAAQRATGATVTSEDLADAPAATVVTAMEVLEHLEPRDQPGFCSALLGAVAPGGLLVLSTPDESLYPGGWSGYAPHVGCVTAPTLAGLLTAAGATDVTIWRIVGGPYDTSTRRRFAEAVGNRTWSALRRLAPSVPAALESRAGARRGQQPTLPPGALDGVRVIPATEGAGGSLLAVVRT